MSRFILPMTLGACLVGGCATVAESALAEDDRQLLCEVLLQAKPAGWRMANNRGGAAPDAYAAMDAGQFRPLPEKIACNGKSLKLASKNREGYGSFVSSYWIGPDRRSVTLEGGYLAAPLLGGTGICTYRRTADGWAEDGCSATSAV